MNYTIPHRRGKSKKSTAAEIIQKKPNPLLTSEGKFIPLVDICRLLADRSFNLEQEHRYISYSGLSSLTGIQTTVLYMKEKQGILECEIIDGMKCLNLNTDRMRSFLEDRLKFLNKKNKKESNNFFTEEIDNTGVPLSRADLAKVQKDEVAAKLGEVKLQKELNVLVLKKFAENVFILFGKTIREMLLPQGQRLAPLVGGIFESVDPEKIRAVQLKIDEENGRCISDVIGIVERGILTDDDLYGDIPEINIEEVKGVE